MFRICYGLARAERHYWARRIEVLVGFARYGKIFDSRMEIPRAAVMANARSVADPQAVLRVCFIRLLDEFGA